MTVSIVQTLVKCKVLTPLRRGPSVAKDPEEALRIKHEQQRASYKRRRALIQQAKENGEPLPVFKLGRPRKYTPEKAAEMRKLQLLESKHAYNARIKAAIEKLEDLHFNQSPSSGEQNFLGSNKDDTFVCSQCSNCSPVQH
jgi:hypothetical protein